MVERQQRISLLEGVPELGALEGKYFRRIPEGVQLLDLLTAEPLEPNQPPPSLLENPVTLVGFRQLEEFGREGGTVRLVLGGHGVEQDFVDMAEQHSEVLGMAPVVGIEADWHRAQPRTTLPHFSEVTVRVAEAAGRAEFQQAQLRWLQDQQKLVLPCDYSHDDELYRAMLEAYDQYREVSKNKAMDTEIRNMSRVILNGAVQVTRQWAIVGQFGYWLGQAKQTGLLPPQSTVPLILGSWHAGSRQRLELLGVPATSHETQLSVPFEYGWYGKVYMDVIAQGRATFEQLAVSIPY